MSGTGLNTSSLFDRDAVFPTLRAAGYATAIFGKIHNDQHSWLCGNPNHSEPFGRARCLRLLIYLIFCICMI